jgi:hypothetical protein
MRHQMVCERALAALEDWLMQIQPLERKID